MRQILSIPIKESIQELRLLQKQNTSKYKALQMLLLLRQKGPLSKNKLSELTGAYVKRKFGARLKVSRKSHVLKSPADEAVFKKSVRKIGRG